MGDRRVSVRSPFCFDSLTNSPAGVHPMRSATLKLSPLDNSHPNTKQIHIPLPTNLRFSLRCCIHLALGLGEIGLHYHCATTDICNG